MKKTHLVGEARGGATEEQGGWGNLPELPCQATQAARCRLCSDPRGFLPHFLEVFCMGTSVTLGLPGTS